MLLDSNQYLKHFVLCSEDYLCYEFDDFSLPTELFHGLPLFALVFKKHEVGLYLRGTLLVQFLVFL